VFLANVFGQPAVVGEGAAAVATAKKNDFGPVMGQGCTLYKGPLCLPEQRCQGPGSLLFGMRCHVTIDAQFRDGRELAVSTLKPFYFDLVH
jgi:hypothetical protein